MIHARTQPAGTGPRSAPTGADAVGALKMQILRDRLSLSEVEAIEMMSRLRSDAAKQLGVPPSVIEIDFEFSGRELDFTITANMQNLPPTRSTRP